MTEKQALEIKPDMEAALQKLDLAPLRARGLQVVVEDAPPAAADGLSLEGPQGIVCRFVNGRLVCTL